MKSKAFWRRAGRVLAVVLPLVIVLALVPATSGALPLVSTIHTELGPGTNPPPSHLGPYHMTPLGPDEQEVGLTSSLNTPYGPLNFYPEVWHTRVGLDWPSWSHGYTGDVYVAGGELGLELPPETYAFSFYVQPEGQGESRFLILPFTDVDELPPLAPSKDEELPPNAVLFSASGNGGARYVGIYSTDAPIMGVIILSEAEFFAIGEFGVQGGGGPGRTDVATVIYGGWDGIPVDCWVGGTAQQTLYTAQDAFGNAAVQWQFYPGDEVWNVSVSPRLPAGLDPERWKLNLIRISMPLQGTSVESPTAGSVSIAAGQQYVIYYQLVDTGAQ